MCIIRGVAICTLLQYARAHAFLKTIETKQTKIEKQIKESEQWINKSYPKMVEFHMSPFPNYSKNKQTDKPGKNQTDATSHVS